MGYKNPDQVPLKDDVVFRGICVYVPDCPEYVMALMGSLTGLGQWVNWERDDEKSATRSAELWRMANEKTVESWASDCGGDCMTFNCDEMKDCLIEIAKAISVNVNVTNRNRCGGGASSTTLYCVNDDGTITINPPAVDDDIAPPVMPLPDGWEIPEPLDPDGEPPDGWETWADYDADACEAANALVDWSFQASTRLAEFFTQDIYGITAIFAVVVNVYTLGWAAIFSSAFFLKLAEALRRLWDNTELVDELLTGAADYIAENRQELVCMLYENRYNAADWENQLVTLWAQSTAGGLASQNNQPFYYDVLKYLVAGFTALNQLYHAVTYKLPTDQFLSCGACLDGGLWVPQYSSGYGGVTTYSESVNTFGQYSASVSLTRSEPTGAYGFSAQIDTPNGIGQSNSLTLSFSQSGASSERPWFLQLLDENTDVLKTLNIPAAGVSGYVWDIGTVNKGSVRFIRLTRDANIYAASSPRVFSFSFTHDTERL